MKKIAKWVLIVSSTVMFSACSTAQKKEQKVQKQSLGEEIQLTNSENGHMLTNRNVFSKDSQWVVYDTRPIANEFSGKTIEKVNVDTKKTKVLYTDKNGANVGVVTYNPTKDQVVFIRT